MLCWLQGLDVKLTNVEHSVTVSQGALYLKCLGFILKVQVACQFYLKFSTTLKQFVECTSNVSQLKNGRGSTSSETFQETSPLSSKTNSVLQQYRTAQLHMPVHVVFITVYIISFNANKHVHVTYMSFQGRISHKKWLKININNATIFFINKCFTTHLQLITEHETVMKIIYSDIWIPCISHFFWFSTTM